MFINIYIYIYIHKYICIYPTILIRKLLRHIGALEVQYTHIHTIYIYIYMIIINHCNYSCNSDIVEEQHNSIIMKAKILHVSQWWTSYLYKEGLPQQYHQNKQCHHYFHIIYNQQEWFHSNQQTIKYKSYETIFCKFCLIPAITSYSQLTEITTETMIFNIQNIHTLIISLDWLKTRLRV